MGRGSLAPQQALVHTQTGFVHGSGPQHVQGALPLRFPHARSQKHLLLAENQRPVLKDGSGYWCRIGQVRCWTAHLLFLSFYCSTLPSEKQQKCINGPRDTW